MLVAQVSNGLCARFNSILLGALMMALAAASVQAKAPAPSPKVAHRRQNQAHASVTAEQYAKAMAAIAGLTRKVDSLRTELSDLRRRPNSEASEQVKTQAPPDAERARINILDAEVGGVRPAETQTLPERPAAMTGSDQMSGDGFNYRGLKVSPTGFLELANIFRSRALGNDLFSNFGSIPFASSKAGREAEDKFTARSTRLGLIAQGDPNSTTHLAAIFEMDFLGAAQTANSIEANSFNPRARQMYGTLDLNASGWHVLVGQTWSLATMNGQGITPRNEIIPQTIDAQLVPGFVWTRQPQVRVTKSFGDSLWLSVSLENAQTTFAGAVPANVVDQIANGAGLYGGAVGAALSEAAGGGTPGEPTAATSSLNHLPDVIGKVAYEAKFDGRAIHIEAFGLGRAFTDRIDGSSNTTYGGGVGAGLAATLIPGFLDVEASTLVGKGIGRYGTSLLSDVTFNPSGKIEPIGQLDWLIGATMHATPTLDLYGYAGEEMQQRTSYGTSYGLGSPLIDLGGCRVEGGACAAATRSVAQGTLGAWRKIYEGSLGHAQLGFQYSYSERHAFSGLGGLAPKAGDSMVFTSLRYYPF